MIIKKSNNKDSKVSKCRIILNEMINSSENYSRSDVLKRFREEVNLTTEGSKTYYYNLMKEISEK